MNRVLVILCHPNPRSFNHAVAAAVVERLEGGGLDISLHDLYGEGFDPVLSAVELSRRFSFDELVQRHYRELERADGIVFVHPEWWSQPPAMMKGWLDRVLRPGVGYEFEGEEFMPKSKVALLGGRRALVLVTTDAEAPPQGGAQAAPSEPLLARLWRESLGYCGITDFHFRMLYGMYSLEAADRREWLQQVAALAGELFGRAPGPGS